MKGKERKRGRRAKENGVGVRHEKKEKGRDGRKTGWRKKTV